MIDIEALRRQVSIIRTKVDTLDGKKIGYTTETEFLVQVGRGPKGSYRTKYRIVGSLGRAMLYYNGINIGRGYKKRLLMPSCSRKPVIDQQQAFPFLTKKKKEKPVSPVLARSS